MKATFRPTAILEATAAADYYEGLTPGLGERFTADLERRVAMACDVPSGFPKFHRTLRKLRLDDFPFAAIYLEMPSEICIVAVIDLRRDPQVIHKRLRDGLQSEMP